MLTAGGAVNWVDPVGGLDCRCGGMVGARVGAIAERLGASRLPAAGRSTVSRMSAFDGRCGGRLDLANALDCFACGNLPRFEPLYATPNNERPFVFQAHPGQFEQVRIDPFLHDVIVRRREAFFDSRIQPKRPEMDQLRATYRSISEKIGVPFALTPQCWDAP